jgi:hypothetical protein
MNTQCLALDLHRLDLRFAFPLEVERQRRDWPEKEEREVRWLSHIAQ